MGMGCGGKSNLIGEGRWASRLALGAEEVAHQGGAFFGENACGYGGFGMEGGGG